MIARWLSFKSCVAAVLLILTCLDVSAQIPSDTIGAAMPDTLATSELFASNEAYHNRLVRRAERWNKLIPNTFTLQFAGGIGMFSAGVGWCYGRSDQWETHILFGFTPKRYDYHTYWTLTLRQSYNPWKIHLGRVWSVKPLMVNLSVNSILDGDFWMSEPDRYPHGYYGFSSRMRFHLGLGQRLLIDIPENRRWMSSSLAVYYEISTCDLYVRQKVLNKSIPLRDIISLAIGLQWTI